MPRDARASALAVGAGDALLVVDVQNDFLPGGSLPVPDGDAIITPLNRCLAEWCALGLPVLAARDWHPLGHCSFREQGGPWPLHCVAGTTGAEFAKELALPPSTVIVSKATTRNREAYSAFDGTDLDARLRQRAVRRLVIGGFATEYCVLSTVRDARARAYTVVVLEDAIRAIDVQPGEGQNAKDEMRRLGAILIRSGALVGQEPA